MNDAASAQTGHKAAAPAHTLVTASSISTAATLIDSIDPSGAADAIRQLKGRFEGSLSATLGGRAVNVMGEALAAL